MNEISTAMAWVWTALHLICHQQLPLFSYVMQLVGECWNKISYYSKTSILPVVIVFQICWAIDIEKAV